MKRSMAFVMTVGILVGGCTNSIFAKNLSEIPVTEKIEYIFDSYNIKEDKNEVDIEVLQINGFKDKNFESELNSKFMKQAQDIYDSFETGKSEEEFKFASLDYRIKADNKNILSIISVESETIASSHSKNTTYVIDKQKQKLINLSDLFKGSSYIQKISENIKSQMRNQMKSNESLVYNIDIKDMPEDNFESIKENQNFYINDRSQLVIVFDIYEVAPGYMGSPEFVIPTSIVEDILKDINLIFN